MADKNRNNMSNTLRSLGNRTGGFMKDLTDMIDEVQRTGQLTVPSQRQRTGQPKQQAKQQAKQQPRKQTNSQGTSRMGTNRQMRDRQEMGRRNERVRDSAGNIVYSPYDLNDYDEEPELKNGYKREHSDDEVYRRQNSKRYGYGHNGYDNNDYDDVDVNVKEPLFDKGNKKQLKRAMIYKEVLGRPKGW